MFPEAFRYHVASSVNDFVNNLIASYAPVFDSISHGILSFLLGVNSVLSFIPWWAYIAAVFLLSWYSSKKLIASVVLASLPFMIGMFGLWAMAIESLSVIITAVLMALLIGLPLGVLMAELKPLAMVLRPLLPGWFCSGDRTA